MVFQQNILRLKMCNASSYVPRRKCLDLINKLPLITLDSAKPNEGAYKNHRRRRNANYFRGYGKRSRNSCKNIWPLGFEVQAVPEFLKPPSEPYYKDFHDRREYPPLSLLKLQRLIDLNMLDSSKMIDLVAVINTGQYKINPQKNHYGINLTEEGINNFSATVHIEVQYATEPVIAAIEKNKGTITTKFYDKASVTFLSDLEYFIKAGKPIPRVPYPPADLMSYYKNVQNRGYLADQDSLDAARYETSQKYGYECTKNPFFTEKKSIHHIFSKLNPGWIVDLENKCVLKPKDRDYLEYYGYSEENEML